MEDRNSSLVHSFQQKPILRVPRAESGGKFEFFDDYLRNYRSFYEIGAPRMADYIIIEVNSLTDDTVHALSQLCYRLLS